MAKTIKVLVNTGNEETNKTFDVVQGSGKAGKPTTIKAVKGARYHLEDPAAKNVGPENIRSKRSGKNLHIMLDGSSEADLVIEGYYDDAMLTENNRGLYGRAEDGQLYEYIPEDPNPAGLPINLADGGKPVSQVLGGGQVAEEFELSGLVVAATGFNGLLAGAAAAGAAAAAGGGGGGSATPTPTPTPTPVPSGQTGALADQSDTGTKGDNITSETKPYISGKATAGATVEITIKDASGNTVGVYTTTADASGNYTLQVSNGGNGLGDGVYTPVIKVTNAGGSSTVTGTTFTIDHTPPTTTSTITTVLDDVGQTQGSVLSGGQTDDSSPTVKGSLSSAILAGETVRIYDGATFIGTAVLTDTTHWTFNDTRILANGATVSYTARVVDAAANEGAASSPYTVTINTSVPEITINSIAGDAVNDTTALSGTYDASERGSSANTVTTKPVISGTAVNLDGQTITVTVNNHNYTATVANQAWSVELTDADAVALNHGNTYSVFASATSSNGKQATDTNNNIIINTAAPDIPTVVNEYASSTAPTLTGAALKAVPGNPVTYIALASGDTLTVTVGGATYTGTIGSLPTGLGYDATAKTWSLNTATASPTSGTLALANGQTYDVGVSVTAGAVTKTDISSGELVINTVAPTITLNNISSDNYINNAEKSSDLVISGVTDAQVGSTVTLTGLDGITRTAVVIAGGTSTTNTFSLVVPGSQVANFTNADGSKTVHADVLNAFKLHGVADKVVTIDTTPPANVAITVDPLTGDDFLTADETAGSVAVTGKVSGEFRAGDLVTLTVNGAAYTGAVDAQGNYSISVPGSSLIADSDKKIDVNFTASDAAGNTTTVTPPTHSYVIDSNPAANHTAIVLDPVAGDNIISVTEGNVANINLTGKVTGEFATGDTITASVNGKTFTTQVAADGTFTLSVPTADLKADVDTKVDVRVVATTLSGAATATGSQDYTVENANNLSQVTGLQLDPVTPDNIINVSENTGNIAITGKATGAFVAGDVVSLKVNGTTVTGAVASNGTFSINVSASALVADPDTQIEASITGTGGTAATAAQNYAVDTTPPANVVVTIDAITGDDFLIAGEAATGVTHTLTGKVTGEFRVGDIVTLTINNHNYTGAVDANGGYSITGVLGTDLKADADHTVAASFTASDVAGNTTTVTATRAYTDNSNSNGGLKTAISINPIAGDNILTLVEGNAVQTSITGKVSGTFTAGDTVTLSLNNATVTGAVLADGTFSINVNTSDLKLDADTQIDARVTGTGGDTATASQKYILETSGNTGHITALQLDPVTADNTINLAESTGTVAITGKVTGAFATGDTVTIAVNGTNVTGTVAANGTFSINVAGSDLAADADTSITATVTGTGGTAARATQDYALDTTPPTTTVTINAISVDSGTSSTDFYTNDNDGLSITATLNTALATGESLWYSKDNGATWTNISTSVTGTAVSYVDSSLTSTATIKMQVRDTASNPAATATQLIVIDTNGGSNPDPANPVNPVVDPNANSAEVSIDLITNDTGVSPNDFITNDNNGLTYSGSVTGFTNNGAAIKLVLVDSTGATVVTTYVTPTITSGTSGTWSWTPALPNGATTQPDGQYELRATVVDKAGNTITGAVNDSQIIIIDTAAGNNVDPTRPVDPLNPVTPTNDANTSATLNIVTIHDVAAGSTDSGSSNSDFITNDPSLVVKGTVTGFVATGASAGDKVLVQIVDANSVVRATAYVSPDAAGNWVLNNTANDLADGKYTIRASIVDAAGNQVKAPVTHDLVIDTNQGGSNGGSNPANGPTNPVDPNTTANIAITGITDDTGYNTADYITSDGSLIISGSIGGFSNAAGGAGDKVRVQVVNNVGVVVAEKYVDPSATTWSIDNQAQTIADGSYTIKAAIVDAAGNIVKAAADQPLVITSQAAPTSAAVTIAAISEDTGTSATDYITNDQTILVKGGTSGYNVSTDKLKVQILDSNNNAVATNANITVAVDGSWTLDNSANTLADGVYTLRASITDVAGNEVAGKTVTQRMVIDHSGTVNPGNVPTNDANTSATLNIVTIHDVAAGSTDSGSSSSDFITNDPSLVVKGTVTGFVATGASAGDKVLVQIVDANSVVKATAYVSPDAAGNWVLNNTANDLADGKYTISASIVDAAGNQVKAPVTHDLVIDTNQGGTNGGSNPANGPTNPVDPNTTANIAITDITDDTGFSDADYITSDGNLIIHGTTDMVATAGATGDKVRVQVLNSAGNLVAETYADPSNGEWSFDNQANTLVDGNYTLRAAIVDAAGNVVKAAADQALVINSGNTPTNASLTIAAITDDTGVSATDFVTNDQTLTISGGTNGYNPASGDKVFVQILNGSTVVSSGYATTGTNTWSFNHASAGTGGISAASLADGTYTIRAVYTTAAGVENSQPVTHSLVIDHSGSVNPSSTPNIDPNSSATVAIVGITDDTGASSSDFITSDTTLLIRGSTSGFSTAGGGQGDMVHVTLVGTGANAGVNIDQYVAVDGMGNWSLDSTANALADGAYNVTATLVDRAGNRVNTASAGQATQTIVIDTAGGTNVDPSNNVNPSTPDANTSATVTVDAISTDSGVSSSDFITSDNTLVYIGSVTGFTNNGDVVKVDITPAGGATVTAYTSVTMTGANTGIWVLDKSAISLADGNYTVVATVVDKAGNRVNSLAAGQATQIVTVDTDASKNTDPSNGGNTPATDTNTAATAAILSITTDSGFSSSDFITNDATLLVKGTVSNLATSGVHAGDQLLVEIKNNAGLVVATQYVKPDASGNWELNNQANVLADGKYTIAVHVVDLAGNQIKPNAATQVLVVDTNQGGTDPSSNTNSGTGAAEVDPNAASATVAITGITQDTGFNTSDFITADGTLVISGTSSFTTTAGDKVRVQIVDAANKVVAQTYVGTSGNWSFDNTNAPALSDGNYTLKAAIVDAADNIVKAGTDKPLVISSTAAPTNATLAISAITDDTGTSAVDFITQDRTLTINGTVNNFDSNTHQLLVQVLDSSNTVVTTGYAVVANGTWALDNTANTLTDGKYTIRAVLTNLSGVEIVSTVATHTLDIDNAGGTNPGNGSGGTNPADPNTAAVLSITTIHDVANGSVDSGASSTDFITNDSTLVVHGTVTGFSTATAATGDKVRVQIVDSNNVVVAQQYLAPDATGAWTLDNKTNVLADGAYTLKAVIVDAAGNTVNTEVTHALVIDTNQGGSNPGNNPSNSPSTDPNATSAAIAIGGITTDTGFSASDFITADGTLTISGTVSSFSNTGGAAGDKVRVQVVNATGTVVAETYTDPVSGAWSFNNQSNTLADGNYTLKAAIVDAAGNVVKGAADQVLVIDNGNTPINATLAISSISDDTGVSTTDFVTNDTTLTINGTTAGFNAAGADKILVQVLNGSTVVTSGYATAGVNTWTYTATTLPAGNYTLRAVYTTAAGVEISPPATHSLVVDDSGSINPANGPSGTNPTDPNNGSTVTVAITGITDDTGVNATDLITSDQTLVISGNTANFTNANGGAGDVVRVQIINQANGSTAGNRIDYVTVDANGNWSLNNTANTLSDGTYTLKADIVDQAGNTVKLGTDRTLTVQSAVTPGANPNSAATVLVTAITDDTGVSSSDFITSDNVLSFSGTVTGYTAGTTLANSDKVQVELLAANGTTVIATGYADVTVSGGNATWVWPYQTLQADGNYSVRATLVNTAGLRVNANAAGTNTHAFTIDSAGGTNVDPSNNVNPVAPDANTTATVAITNISDDTGPNANDFVTKDTTLTYSGTVSGFTANGDKVKVELIAADGTTVIATSYVDTSVTGAGAQNGTWTWAYQTTQAAGNYTARATIVDVPGNRVNTATGGQATQIIVVDNSGSTNPDNGRGSNGGGGTDTNTSATVTISTIHDVANGSVDSGELNTDFITNDNTLVIEGTVAGFTHTGATTGDQLLVTVLSGSTVVATQYVTPDSNGNWVMNNKANVLADGAYTINVDIVDLAGNFVKAAAATHSLVIDTNQGGSNPGNNPANSPSTDPNAGNTVTVGISAVTDDTGFNTADFITADHTLLITGTTANFSNTGGGTGDKVRLQVLDSNGQLVAEKYVTPDNAGAWQADLTGTTLPDGNYTLLNAIVDQAGNIVKAGADKPLVISSTAAPTSATVSIASISDDTGFDVTDFITKDNTLTVNGTTNGYNSSTHQVFVQVLNGNTVTASGYATVDGAGKWTFNVTAAHSATALADGSYTLRAVLTNLAGVEVTGTATTHALVVDSSSSVNPGGTDPNNAAGVSVSVSSIHDVANGSIDSGVSSTDFITNDNSLIIKGATVGFSATGAAALDQVRVQILDSNNVVVAQQYVTPDTAGNWAINNQAKPLADGVYSIHADIVDAADNLVKAGTPQALVIDTNQGGSNPGNNPSNSPSTDPNATSAAIAIGGITTDTGFSASDFITADGTLTISGTVSSFSNTGGAAGDKVRVQVVNATGTVVAETYTDPVSGAWSFNNQSNTLTDGNYTLKAAVVDAAGNIVKGAADQALVINSGNAPTSATLTIGSITVDSGTSASDFVTNDTTLTISGTTDGFTINGTDKILVQVIKVSDGSVATSGYATHSNATANAAWTFVTDGGSANIVSATNLANGSYTIRAVYTSNAGIEISQPATQTLVIDNSGGTNFGGGNNGNGSGTTDPNATVALNIDSITDDTGVSGTDLITADNQLVINGSAAGFTALNGGAGDVVRVQIINSSNSTVRESYVIVDANGHWALDNTANTLLDGTYTLKAAILDAAGNTVKAAADKTLVIHTSNSNGTDPNTAATVAITAISDDTGVSASDFITKDNTLTYSGTVTNFTNNSDWVELELVNSLGSTVATQYVKPTAGTWSWAYQTLQSDGTYTLTATVVDEAGTRLNASAGGQATQAVTIDGTNTQQVTAKWFNKDVASSAGTSFTDWTTYSDGVSKGHTIFTEVGTGETLSKVEIYDPVSSTWLAGNLAGGFATFFVDNALAAGSYTFKFRTTDVAGNLSAETTQTLTVEALPTTSSSTNAGATTVTAVTGAVETVLPTTSVEQSFAGDGWDQTFTLNQAGISTYLVDAWSVNRWVNAGAGVDKLKITGSGTTLDLRPLGSYYVEPKLQSFEIIDLETDTGAQTIMGDATAFASIASSNWLTNAYLTTGYQLVIRGNTGDKLVLTPGDAFDNSGWIQKQLDIPYETTLVNGAPVNNGLDPSHHYSLWYNAALNVNLLVDLNVSVENKYITVSGVSTDTGGSATDFVTSDQTLDISGTVTGNAVGDVVKVSVFDSNNNLVVNAATATITASTWTLNNQANTLAFGTYRIYAVLTNGAGATYSSSSHNLTIAPDNTAPVNTLASSFTTNEDTSLVMTGLSVADDGVGSSSYTVNLVVTHGVLNVSGGTATITGSGTTSVTLTGTLAQVNATLAAANGVVFAPATNYNGSAQLTMTTNDNASVDAKTDVDIATITVNAVNDAPTAANATLTVLEDGSKVLAASDFGFADVDGHTLVSVKITSLPTAGSLKLNGVAVNLNDTVAKTDIDAGHLIFTPAPGAHSTSYATLQFKVIDSGSSNNESTTTNTLTFDVTAVAPTQTVQFSSMTKDSGTAAADWTTADTSAGRLVSGTLSAPLLGDEQVAVFSNGTLIGNATVINGGTAWAITDTNGYSANWTYTAKVVEGGGLSSSTATQVVNIDTTVVAPVITGVKDSANASVATGGSTANLLSSVSGTGEAGATIYLYDNSIKNLVGTAIVANDNTWTVTGMTGVASGSNTFSAVQTDATGNVSTQSNLWSATSTNTSTNQVVNGDFSTDGLVGFTTGSNVTLLNSVDVFSTAFNIGIQTLASLPSNFSAPPNGATDTTVSGTAAANVTWTKQIKTAWVNPDGALQGNVLGYNFVNNVKTVGWQTSMNVVAGKTYALKFDYVANSLNFGVDIDGVSITLSEAGHLTVFYTATATKTINTSLWGVNSAGTVATPTGTGGDSYFDNISFVEATPPADSTLAAGAFPQGATTGDNALTYTTGAVTGQAGNDTITATGTDLQSKLATGGKIDGGAGLDTLKLAAGTTLDLTSLTVNQTVKPIQEVEIFQLQGTSKLTVSANDVLSLGSSNSTTMASFAFASTTQTADGSVSATGSTSSTGKVQLVINGTNTDSLSLSGLFNDAVAGLGGTVGNTGLTGQWDYKGQVTLAGHTYKVYDHSTTGAQVLADLTVAVSTNTPLLISAISTDAGGNAADFITNDTTLIYSGKLASGFNATTEKVKIQVLDGSNTVVQSGYGVVNGNNWTWDNSANALTAGNYTIKASVVNGTTDALVSSYGINGVSTQALTVDVTAPNAGAAPTVVITTDANNDGSIDAGELNGATTISVKGSWSGTAAVGDQMVFSNGSTQSTVVLNSADIANKFVTTTFAKPADGSTLTITGQLKDTAGNATATASDSAYVDGFVNTAPVASSTSVVTSAAALSTPTVTITDNQAASVANGGTTTHTLTFSEAIDASSLTASDIKVTNGTLVAGSLTQVDSTHWTVQTTAPASGSGALAISLDNGSYTSAKGVSGMGGSGTQDYGVTTANSTFDGATPLGTGTFFDTGYAGVVPTLANNTRDADGLNGDKEFQLYNGSVGAGAAIKYDGSIVQAGQRITQFTASFEQDFSGNAINAGSAFVLGPTGGASPASLYNSVGWGGSGLSFDFYADGTTGLSSVGDTVRINWNQTVLAEWHGPNLKSLSARAADTVTISVTEAGTATLLLHNSTDADISLTANIPNWATVNQTGWQYWYAGSTGGNSAAGDSATASAWVDNISINASLGASGTVVGTAAADTLLGSDAADTITGAGGADIIMAGAGNDTVILNADNVTQLGNTNTMVIDGGAGTNALSINAAGSTLDLTSATVANKVVNFSSIDLTGTGNNTLKVNWNEVMNLNSAHQLVVNGNAGDAVQLVDLSSWTKSATASTTAALISAVGDLGFVTGHSYFVFTLNGATMYVDNTITSVTTATNTTASTSPALVGVMQTVSSLFASAFTDVDATQALKGVAITGVAAGGNGKYQVSADGVTWTDVGAVSDTSAVYASAGSFIRYLTSTGATTVNMPNLTVRLIDTSGQTATSALVTGNTVDAHINGGTTAFSANTVVLTANGIVTNVVPVTLDALTTGSTALSNFSVTQTYASSEAMTVTLTTDHGTLTAGTGTGVTASGSGTATLTLTGNKADINALLATSTGVVYNGGSYTGAATISMTSKNTASGVTDTDVVSFNVAPVLANVSTANFNSASSTDLGGATMVATGSGGGAILMLSNISPSNGTNHILLDSNASAGTGTLLEWQNNVVPVGDRAVSLKASFLHTYQIAATTDNGMSFSFGLPGTMPETFSSTSAWQQGFSTGLAVRLKQSNSSETVSIAWNGTVLATSNTPIVEFQWDQISISVSPDGIVTMTMHNLASSSIADRQISATIPNWATVNMDGWKFGMSGANTTGFFGWDAVDNLSATWNGSGPTGGTIGTDTWINGSADGSYSGNGGADKIYGMAGNDTITLNADNVTQLGTANNGMMVDGGTGFNALKLAAGGVSLDLTNATVKSHLQHFSSIDLTGTGANTVKVDLSAVQTLSGKSDVTVTTVNEAHALVINGDADDTVQLVNLSTWTKSATTSTATSLTAALGAMGFTTGHNYNTYTLGDATLYVDAGITNITSVAGPVVLDLNRDGLLSYTQQLMNANSHGGVYSSAWAGAQDGVLVLNSHGDNLVHDASQYEFTQYGGNTDLEGLALGFDTNKDGVLDAHDAQFAQFSVWQDVNGDGVSEAGEVRSLADWGIAQINLTQDGVQRTPAAGVTEYGHTTALNADGSSMLVADAAFNYAEAQVKATTLDAGGVHLDLTGHDLVLNLSNLHAIYGDVAEVDLASSGHNTVSLSLGDVLSLPTHALKLTGDATDKVNLNAVDWLDSGAHVTQAGHTYEVYTANNGAAAQLLIDQSMIVVTH
jgi:hypothetical protein